jgi:hypothetical protein
VKEHRRRRALQSGTHPRRHRNRRTSSATWAVGRISSGVHTPGCARHAAPLRRRCARSGNSRCTGTCPPRCADAIDPRDVHRVVRVAPVQARTRGHVDGTVSRETAPPAEPGNVMPGTSGAIDGTRRARGCESRSPCRRRAASRRRGPAGSTLHAHQTRPARAGRRQAASGRASGHQPRSVECIEDRRAGVTPQGRPLTIT